MSCDNIPGNGIILGGVVRALAERRGRGLADWIAANAAFPSTMVDRIAPATTPADLADGRAALRLSRRARSRSASRSANG